VNHESKEILKHKFRNFDFSFVKGMTDPRTQATQPEIGPQLDPREQAERFMGRPTSTAGQEMSLVIKREGNTYLILARPADKEASEQIVRFQRAVEEYTNERGRLEIIASLSDQARNIARDLHRKIESQQPLTNQDKVQFDQMVKALADIIPLLPENMRAELGELVKQGNYGDFIQKVDQHLKESSSALEKKLQEINNLSKISPKTASEFYAALGGANGCADMQFVDKSSSNSAVNMARDYYTRALHNIMKHIDPKTLSEGSFMDKFNSVAEISYNQQRIKVLGIDAMYIEQSSKDKGLPSTSKALDPRIAKALDGFVRFGIYNPETQQFYKPEELMRLWGFENRKDFNFAIKHLYGSINEGFYKKIKFAGLEAVPEADKAQVAAQLARDAEGLWNDRINRGEEKARLLTAGAVALFGGLLLRLPLKQVVKATGGALLSEKAKLDPFTGLTIAFTGGKLIG
jgi:hypothetical protein